MCRPVGAADPGASAEVPEDAHTPRIAPLDTLAVRARSHIVSGGEDENHGQVGVIGPTDRIRYTMFSNCVSSDGRSNVFDALTFALSGKMVRTPCLLSDADRLGGSAFVRGVCANVHTFSPGGPYLHGRSPTPTKVAQDLEDWADVAEVLSQARFCVDRVYCELYNPDCAGRLGRCGGAMAAFAVAATGGLARPEEVTRRGAWRRVDGIPMGLREETVHLLASEELWDATASERLWGTGLSDSWRATR